MKIIRHYILRNTIMPFLVALFVFTFVLLLLKLVKIAELVLVKGADPLAVLHLLMLLAVYLLNFTIPIAALIAVTLTFGRLSTDNELMALKASGIRLWSILEPVFVMGLILSFFCLFLSDRLLPAVHGRILETFYNIGKKNPVSLITPGTFVKFFEGNVLYIKRLKGSRMEDVKIYQDVAQNHTRIIMAKSGIVEPTFDGENVHMRLEEGSVDEPGGGGLNYYRLNFKTYAIDLAPRRKSASAVVGGNDLKGMTLAQLAAEKRQSQAAGIDTMPIEMELHSRLAFAFGVMVFIIAGLAFSLTTRRSEKTINFAYSVGLIVLYYVLSAGGAALAFTGKVPAVLCAWVANLAIGGVGFAVLLIRDRA